MQKKNTNAAQLQVRVQVDLHSYVACHRFLAWRHWHTCFFRVAAVMLLPLTCIDIFVMLAMQNTTQYVINITYLFAFGFSLWFAIAELRRPKQHYKRQEARWQAWQNYTFEADRFHYACESSQGSYQAELPYAQLRCAYERKQAIYLQTTDQTVYILPKKQINSKDGQALCALLLQSLGKKKYKS